MKFFITVIFLCLNVNVYAEILYYKNVKTSEEDSDLMKVKFPEECSEIIEINNDESLEFKNNEEIEKKISECKNFTKGQKVKNALKSGTNTILKSGVKVKEGIQEGFKSGQESITNSVSKETNLILKDTIKIKDGIVDNTSKIINGTLKTGEKISSGVGSFFKGLFSSEK